MTLTEKKEKAHAKWEKLQNEYEATDENHPDWGKRLRKAERAFQSYMKAVDAVESSNSFALSLING